MSSSAYSSSAYPHAGTDPLAPPLALDGPGRSFERVKRAMDVTVALLVLCAGFPVLVVIALAIKLSSPGPVLFRQQRLGRGGTFFWCYKFRSMVQDAEIQLLERDDIRDQFDENFKLRSDPRVTRLGAFLRKSSLDELPQFWNVLRGEMSLIGPRPIVAPELAKYGACAPRLLSVKPGLGGIWQVSGRSETTYAERVAMDMQYVKSRSVALDLKLLVCTAITVVRGRGAY